MKSFKLQNKIIIVGVLISTIVIGYFVVTDKTKNIDRSRIDDESFVYETEADTIDECSTYEKFDSERKVCYFECADENDCAQILKDIDSEIDSWTDDTYTSAKTNEKQNKDLKDKAVAEYSVDTNEQISLKSGTSRTEDMQIWKHISDISLDWFTDTYIETYQTFNDVNDDTLAFVDDEDNNGKWRVAVNVAGYNDSTARERNLTIVHELGHIVTLNVDQLKQGDKSKCKNYFIDEGCANANSYLNIFVNTFKNWEANYTIHNFVTEYAATSVEEDVAESFAYFVIDSKINNESSEVKDQKVNLFYQFPELVQMREGMRQGIKSDIIRARKSGNI